MQKKLLVILVLLVFGVTSALIGCKSNNQVSQNPPAQSGVQNNTQQSATANQTFTAADLKNYTGQNGTKAYVAVSGIVYDVTHARRWKNGQHEEGIVAGADLTDAIGNSPHGTSVLSEVPKVGILK